MSLTPITKEAWEALSPKQKWDSIVALRGPDCPSSETIKWFTSSIIRGKLSQIMRVGGTVNDDLNLIVLPNNPYLFNYAEAERNGLRKQHLWSATHFCGHIGEAAVILNIPYIEIDPALWNDTMGLETSRAVIKLWQEMRQESAKEELARHFKRMWGRTPEEFIEAKKKYDADVEALKKKQKFTSSIDWASISASPSVGE
jgi:hypothetical protein